MNATLEIDCPNQDETVVAGHYAFRLSCGEALVEAEVSVDRGPWRQCRHACGLWWYDWDGAPGEHQVCARGFTRDGRPANSTPRRFKVAHRGR